MARKKKSADGGPSNAYLLSFGDTMTALLAFFIVLNSLAEDQTGANLYRGTGSFVSTLDSFGMPRDLPEERQRRVISHEEPGPLYVVPDPDATEPDRVATGPDENDNEGRIIDREREDFERFVDQLAELSDLEESPGVLGEATFDYFNKLPAKSPYLDEKYRRALSQVIPLLSRPQYQVEIIVWAPTPAPTAWHKAGLKAVAVGRELAQMGNLSAEQLTRLQTTFKPWMDAKAKRPVLTVVTRKLGS
jgi:hypothetical protein